MSKPYDAVIFIGRFQPLHQGHVVVFQKAALLANTVIGLIGSADQPRSLKNPFTVTERMKMLHDSLDIDLGQSGASLYTEPLPDTLDDDAVWAHAVRKQVTHAMKRALPAVPQKVALIGYEKDDSSYYLHLFAEWDYVAVPPTYVDQAILNATDIRRSMYQGQIIKSVLPKASQDAIRHLLSQPEGKMLCAQYAGC